MHQSIARTAAAITTVLHVAAQAAPQLEVRRVNNNIELKWPSFESDWRLQSAASLTLGPWTDVMPAPPVIGSSFTYAAPFQSTPRFFRLACNGAADVPDAAFNDTNCDGIDGDASQAIFVAKTGSDTNVGTRELPVASLALGITRAAEQGKDVYVGLGTYTVMGSLNLSSGVSLYGQYNPAAGWSRAAANTTTIVGGTTAILAQNVSSETHVEGFTIRSADASSAGQSSYGARIITSAGPVVMRYNLIEAGDGFAGSPGSNNSNGDSGGDGGGGQAGDPDDEDRVVNGGVAGSSLGGRMGGKGGNGGKDPGFNGANGEPGAGGTSGGPGGSAGDPGGSGGDGTSGTPGANGSNGSGGLGFGTISGNLYAPAAGIDGTAGATGNGGGGGGGGGGQTCTFCFDGAGNGGGGGGGGGSGGHPGLGGNGGGGSFGILVITSTATLSDNVIITGTGGAGGKGGNGGNGGLGGVGGPGNNLFTSEIGRGGRGGDGGRGGNAGNGGGGGGGPSVGIQRVDGTVTATGNNYSIGSGGAGGTRGSNALGQGQPGIIGLTATLR